MFSPPADSLDAVVGVAAQGAYSYAVGGHGETAGSCPRSRFPNKGLLLPNKCPPQSVIDHFTPPPPPPLPPPPPFTGPLLSRFLSAVGEVTAARRAAVPPPVQPGASPLSLPRQKRHCPLATLHQPPRVPFSARSLLSRHVIPENWAPAGSVPAAQR